jgi:hypothetical protein
MLGDLDVCTLRSIRTMTQFFFSFEHQTSHAACFNARGLLYECVFNALLFSSSYRPVGKPVSHHVDTRPPFSSFLFGTSYRPSCPPRCSDTTLWVHPWCPLNFFIVIRSIGSLLPIGYHSTSLRLARLQNRSAAKLICSFFFRIDVHAIRPVDSSTTCHDLSKVAVTTPRSGSCETWVPLGPHRLGSQPSLTTRSGLPEDLPTCQWAQPT